MMDGMWFATNILVVALFHNVKRRFSIVLF
jgi:hypothetical protein